MRALGARIFGYSVAALVLIAVAGAHHVDARQAPAPQRAHPHPLGCASLQRAQRHLADSEAALHTYMMAHKITPAELRANLTTDPTLATLYEGIQSGQATLTAVEGHLAQINSAIQRARRDFVRSSAALHAYLTAHHIAPVEIQAQVGIDPVLTKLYQRMQADQKMIATTQLRLTAACR